MSTNYTWLGIYVEIIYHPWVKSILTVRDPHVKWETPWNLTHREKLLRGKSVIKLREKRAHEGGAGWAGPRPGQDGSHQKKKKEYKLVRTRILTATWRRAYTTHTTCHIWYIHTQAQPTWTNSLTWFQLPRSKVGPLSFAFTHHFISCILLGFANWLSLLLKCKQPNQQNKKNLPLVDFLSLPISLVGTNLCGDPRWLLFSWYYSNKVFLIFYLLVFLFILVPYCRWIHIIRTLHMTQEVLSHFEPEEIKWTSPDDSQQDPTADGNDSILYKFT